MTPYFQYIKIAETENWNKYLYKKLMTEFSFEEKQYLIKILDEMELYEIYLGKFYKNKAALNSNDELLRDSIHFSDLVTGLYEEATIVKKLIFSKNVDNIYEIRMSSDHFEHRILNFPYDNRTEKNNNNFITLTYGFNKKGTTKYDNNIITDTLRDSSQRIRDTFYEEEKNIIKYIPNIK